MFSSGDSSLRFEDRRRIWGARPRQPLERRGTQAPQFPLGDTEQFDQLAKLYAGTEEVLYRLGLDPLSFRLRALPNGIGFGKLGNGPREQTRRGQYASLGAPWRPPLPGQQVPGTDVWPGRR